MCEKFKTKAGLLNYFTKDPLPFLFYTQCGFNFEKMKDSRDKYFSGAVSFIEPQDPDESKKYILECFPETLEKSQTRGLSLF